MNSDKSLLSRAISFMTGCHIFKNQNNGLLQKKLKSKNRRFFLNF